MVFSSVPIYLDHSNWQQQQFHLPPVAQAGIPTISSTSNENPPSQLAALAAPGQPGSIRPCSMADRARLAKIPLPEAALKCPRCESTNTKFCYFNNYSLSQPRHFCKTCRRYWTRGGALRNVPVGGGCRRNKKNKNSKSSAAADKQRGTPNGLGPSEIPGGNRQHSAPPTGNHLSSLVASLQSLSNYGVGNMGLNFGGIHGPLDMGVNIPGGGGEGTTALQQFPVFEMNDPSANSLLQFQGERIVCETSENNSMIMSSMGSRVLQMVKMEQNHQELNLTRPLLGFSAENNSSGQFCWGGNTWTDLSGLNSSATANSLL